MDTLLTPWIATADRLLPNWRASVRNGDAIAVPTRRDSKAVEPLVHDEQLTLRETLELFAIAVSVDPRQFHALASGVDNEGIYELYEPLERVRLRLQVDLPGCSSAFAHNWNEATASDDFARTKKQLEGLKHGFPGENRVQLQVEIRIVRSHNGRNGLQLYPAVEFLKRVNRAFDVTHIKIVIATAFLGPGSLAALFQTAEKCTESASVLIQLDISQPCDEHVRLADWKTIFDMTTRRQTSTSGTTSDWEIDVIAGGGFRLDELPCEPTEDDAHMRVIAACLSALAHAGDQVTSLTLHNLLEDPSERDCYKPTERRARAKWLGYLLRFGSVERLTISETTLTQDDMDMIASTLQAQSHQACLRSLWNESWHEEKIMDMSQEPKSPCEDLKISQRVFKPEEIVGVMHNVDENDHLVDVLIAGYGQCTVPRLSFARLQEMDLPPTSSKRLTSLTIRLSEGDGTEGHLLRLAMLAGKDLEELVIDAAHSQIALPMLIIILASCPRLKRLDVKTVYLTSGDDEQLYLPTHWANHPLEHLSVDIHLNEASIGLCGLASMLVLFGVHLKTLRIRAEPSMTVNHAARPAMENMLRVCGKSLQKLEVLGLSAEYFQGLLTADALGLNQLATLVLTDTASNRLVWEQFMATLASPPHPLTCSLHTLRILVRSVPGIPELVATMLQTNNKLVHCQLQLPRHMLVPLAALGATQGRALRRRKAPMTLRQKAAFLSSVQGSVIPWEASVLATIFRFAESTETRRIVVSTC